MQYRTVFLVLAVALCATPVLGMVDVVVQIARPMYWEIPGLVPVTIRLTDTGDTPTLVESLQVTISDGYYSFMTDIPRDPHQPGLFYMPTQWVYGGGTETCTAWITDPADENHDNDTAVVIVTPVAGLSERAGTELSKLPGRLGGSITRTTCFVSHTEPLDVTLFDIKGRAVLASRLYATLAGKSSLDLRGLRSGVYLARLDDGRSTVTQKLVVER
jgi:hypothetical protein